MNVFELEKLEGQRLPPGTYRIEPDAHTQMTEAIHAGNYNFDSAHPVYAHLAPHCGMGWRIDEFFDFVQFPMDGGALYGEGNLTYHKPIQVGVDYTVNGHINSAVRKQGKKTGTFDLVTLHLDLIDAAGDLVVTSIETYVLPRVEIEEQ